MLWLSITWLEVVSFILQVRKRQLQPGRVPREAFFRYTLAESGTMIARLERMNHDIDPFGKEQTPPLSISRFKVRNLSERGSPVLHRESPNICPDSITTPSATRSQWSESNSFTTTNRRK